MAAPVKTFRCQNVSVAVFKNENGQFSLKLSASYKPTGSQEWKYTDSLGTKDALAGAHLLRKAADWVMENDTQRPALPQQKPAPAAVQPFRADKPARITPLPAEVTDAPTNDDVFSNASDEEVPF